MTDDTWLECILCGASTPRGHTFYDHLEDVHMMPIRRERINEYGFVVEETHDQCLERFKFNHEEYSTELCWCPECLGGETLEILNDISSEHGELYIREIH